MEEQELLWMEEIYNLLGIYQLIAAFYWQRPNLSCGSYITAGSLYARKARRL
jgi:hypothetical protein